MESASRTWRIDAGCPLSLLASRSCVKDVERTSMASSGFVKFARAAEAVAGSSKTMLAEVSLTHSMLVGVPDG